MAAKLIDLTGKRFHKLVVLKRAENGKRHEVRWHCQCDCGNLKTVRGDHLKKNQTQSCGCLAREINAEIKKGNKNRETHGLVEHPLYRKWQAIKRRCTNPNTRGYRWYGDAGVKLCDQWFNDPQAFIYWIEENLGECPEGHSLDRIDPFGNYEPENLRWATQQQQMNNLRGHHAKKPNSGI